MVAALLRPAHPAGIASYGAYVPRWRVSTAAIAACWGLEPSRVPVRSKSVPGPDEDATTMSIEAASQALARLPVNRAEIRALWVGSESKPYAVKPTSTIVAEALGLTPHINAADLEFACKAGSEAMQVAIGYVGSGMARYAMAIGMDAAQSQPGDSLEYTAAAGGAAYLVGPGEEAIAEIEASYSFVTDTPDFFRRAHCHYPEHGQRFTGAPSYFAHSARAAQTLLESLNRNPKDYRWGVFHQPNPKFVLRLAQELGFEREQIEAGFLVPEIGNTYAGCSLIALAAVLDVAQPGERIFFTSYGSGAGSDAMSLLVTPRIRELANRRPTVRDLIARKQMITDYGVYLKLQGKIRKE